MQQFTVPQFIDVEDKIIGPITTRQFVILLGGFVGIGICYKIADFSLFVTLALTIFVVCIVFAFFKINGRPFHLFLLNFVQTLRRPYLRVWNNKSKFADEIYDKLDKVVAEEKPTVKARKFSNSRLTELALVVDTRGAFKGFDTSAIDKKIEF